MGNTKQQKQQPEWLIIESAGKEAQGAINKAQTITETTDAIKSAILVIEDWIRRGYKCRNAIQWCDILIMSIKNKEIEFGLA